jgi:hypothetical protein
MTAPIVPSAPAKQKTELEVTVVLHGGDPVAKAEITVDGLHGPQRKLTTPTNGTVVFLLTPQELGDDVDKVQLTARKPLDAPRHGVSELVAAEQIIIAKGLRLGTTMNLKDPCLLNFPDPQTDGIRAWDMTLEQAIRTLVFLHARNNKVVLKPNPVFSHKDGVCQLVSPSIDPNKIKDQKVTLDPDKVNGVVKFRYCDFKNNIFTKDRKVLSAHVLGPIQPRNAVGYFRLAKHVFETWGVTTVLHVGILAGGRHDRGHCLDYTGGIGTVPGSHPKHANKELDLHVYIDWGSKPTPKVDAQGNLVQPPKVGEPGYSIIKSFPRLPYRLEAMPGADELARDFFLDVYQFLLTEYPQTSSQKPTQSAQPASNLSPGEITGLTIYPDYPKANSIVKDDQGNEHEQPDGRGRHNNHIHIEMPEGLP